MKQIIHKLFFIWEYEKEEKWLNEMAAKGLLLTDVGLCRYVFEEGTPGAYQYRLQMLPNSVNHPESRKFIEFVEETGAEHVGTFKNWVYFRRPASDAPFDIYSDLDNKIKHMERIYRLSGILGSICLAAGTVNLVLGLGGDDFTSGFNIGASIPCMLFGLIIAAGAGRMTKPLKKLKAERKLSEYEMR